MLRLLWLVLLLLRLVSGLQRLVEAVWLATTGVLVRREDRARCGTTVIRSD